MIKKYKLGSLFDGSGGFPLASSLCGIVPVWASEVEPYPIAVTRSRFPQMKHLGDISKVNGAEIEPVDIISFGSPCQGLSVAGLRKGLEDERSGLFMQAIRIFKEMRRATNGQYPRFLLWENVPGALSSGTPKGEDFRIVLQEIIQIVEPGAVMPSIPKAGWAYADSYTGDGWSLAYRIFNAQHWGVPQRRRRIHLIVDFRGECAREVLFEREGLRGYFAEGRTPWQGSAGNAQDCAGADDREGENRVFAAAEILGRANCGIQRQTNGGEGAHRGYSVDRRGRGLDAVGFDAYNQVLTGDKSMTVTCSASDAHHVPCVVTYGIDHAITTGGNCTAQGPCVYEEIQATLKASGPHAVDYSFDSLASNSMKSSNPYSGCRLVGEPIPIHDMATRFAGRRGDKQDGKGNGLGVGDPGAPMNTLTSADRHAVAYSIGNGQLNQISMSEVCNTLDCMHDKQAVIYRQGGFADYVEGEVGTLRAAGCDYGGGTENILVQRQIHCIVRRLMPIEAARLQGFADRWGDVDEKDSFTPEEFRFWHEVRNTHAAINGKAVKEYTEAQMLAWYNKLHADSAEYKMWGNGIALPPALYCMQGIVEAMEKSDK